MRNFEVPEALRPLIESSKLFRIGRGGRGGGKSEMFAGNFLAEGLAEKHTFLNAREVQKSLDESVYATYEKVAFRLGVHEYFRWLKGKIIALPTGSEYLFYGLSGNQMQSLKSIPDIDRVWLEEGQAVSDSSFEILKPTFMRNAGAQCWISYNPDLETDTVHVLANSGDSRVELVEIGLDDNPWATGLMFEERKQAYLINPIKAQHVWGGSCVSVVEGAIYEKQIAEAEKAGRIGHYPRKEGAPVYFGFDIGGSSQSSDHMAVVGYQWLAGERRYVFAWETRGETINYHCDEIRRRAQAEAFTIGGIYLPHDARHHHGESYESVEDIVRKNFPGVEVDVVERTNSVVSAIEHVRDRFSECTFDANGAEALIHSVRRYSWAKNKNDVALHPLHDSHSDMSDAFRTSIMHAVSVTSGAPRKHVKISARRYNV